MPLTIEVLAMLAFTLTMFWGIATWALVRTLRQEGEKVEILEHQDRIDTYSPRALSDLREWIDENPDDPLADEARAAYNECVETLKETDQHYYDWSASEIDSLDRV